MINLEYKLRFCRMGRWIYRTPLTNCGALTDSEWALFQKETDVIDIGCANDKNYSHQFA